MRAPGLTQILSQPDWTSDQTLPKVCHLLYLCWFRLSNESLKEMFFLFFSLCVWDLTFEPLHLSQFPPALNPRPRQTPIRGGNRRKSERFQLAGFCLSCSLSFFSFSLHVVACAQLLWLKAPMTLSFRQWKTASELSILLSQLPPYWSWLFSVGCFFSFYFSAWISLCEDVPAVFKVNQSPNYATAQTPRQYSPNYLHVCTFGSQRRWPPPLLLYFSPLLLFCVRFFLS